MSRPPLLQLSDISLTFGGEPVFDGLDLTVQPGDRVALVGRNGSGKSTLMKVMAALVEPDRGSRATAPGVSVGYMEQEPDLAGFATLGDFAAAGLPADEAYKVELVTEGLALDPSLATDRASGGERRRAALARLLAAEPELMLLDEPTNHLDIAAIGWLEARLRDTRAGYVLISHDRAFLTALTRATLWIDRGAVRRADQGFAAFERWRDKVWAEEDTARHKLDRKIKAEARWAVEGISARRKRNQGRLRALQAMRADRAAAVARAGTADLALAEGPQSGKRVIDAEGLTKRFGARTVIANFSLRVMRGERVAFIGPNGAGKSTLIKLLTGELAPDVGTVKLGSGLEPAVFDQNRAQLDPDATLWDTLTDDPAMRVSGRADQVMVRSTPKHVVGYLKEFLFDERQARAPVRSLSGGERARLLLAKLMAKPSNLLVLDEPTNDLDIDTLDLLQEVVGEFAGTVLLVSHDRDFIDRIATTSVVLDGRGRAVVYAGGWTDARAQGAVVGAVESAPTPAPKPVPQPAAPASPVAAPAPSRGLSFSEAHRLEVLPAEIAQLEQEIAKLEGLLADPELFSSAPAKFAKASEALAARQSSLSAAEEEWLGLAERAEEG